MNVEEILESWEHDCQIDDTHLDRSSIETSKLHSKYLKLLISNKIKLVKLESEYKTLKHKKIKYYRGEMSKEELLENSWPQYEGLKPLKSDMDDFLDGDIDINKQVLKVNYIKSVIELIESIMNQLKARDWQIRNAITWKTFVNGG